MVNVIPTSRPAELCRPLMADPRLAKVSFTGSTAVGRTLLQQSGARVLRTSMELGGNAPFLVFDDADLDLAVDQAFVAKMRLARPVLCGRQPVPGAGRDRRRLRRPRWPSGWRPYASAHPTPTASSLGPLIDSRGVAKAERLVDDAVQRGAVIAGRAVRPDGPGCYFGPVVLDHVPADAALMDEEIFAPVAAISRFHTEAEAVARANDTEHGLAAFVITRDGDRARRVAARLQAGMVGINRGVVSNVAAPFGGVKQSGLGREGGPEGLRGVPAGQVPLGAGLLRLSPCDPHWIGQVIKQACDGRPARPPRVGWGTGSRRPARWRRRSPGRQSCPR